MWRRLGAAVYWLTWPGLWLLLYRSRRTRAVIVHDGRVLVVRPWLSNGKWSLPGGGINSGEDPGEAILREVKEETALQLKPDQVKLLGKYRYRQDGLTFHYDLYVARLNKSPKLSRQKGEILNIDWRLPAELSRATASDDVIRGLEALNLL